MSIGLCVTMDEILMNRNWRGKHHSKIITCALLTEHLGHGGKVFGAGSCAFEDPIQLLALKI